MRIFLFFLIIVLFSTGCKERFNYAENDNVFDLTSLDKKSEYVTLADIADSVSYIQLEETNDPRSALDVKNSLKIIAFDHAIFAYSFGSIIKVFSGNGKYLKSIGSIGSGPGEFVRIDQLSSNSEADGVWVLDRYRHRLTEIGIDGFVRNSFAVSNSCVRFAVSQESEIYLLCQERLRENLENSYVEVINKQGDSIKRFPLYQNRSYGVGQISAKKQNFYLDQGKLYHSDQPFDTLYSFTRDSIWKPTYILDLGPTKIKVEDMSDPRKLFPLENKFPYINNLFDFPLQIFATTRNRDAFTCFILDKKTKSCQIASRHVKEQQYLKYRSGLKNDIDGGLPFWPMNHKNITVLYRFFDPFYFNEYFSQHVKDKTPVEKGSELDRFLKNYKLYGNPIIMFVKLKQ